VHDPAPALRVHARQDRAQDEERRLDHEREHPVELFRRELLDRGHVLHAGTVDDDVGGEVEPAHSGGCR
jgi:hypothetical protein